MGGYVKAVYDFEGSADCIFWYMSQKKCAVQRSGLNKIFHPVKTFSRTMTEWFFFLEMCSQFFDRTTSVEVAVYLDLWKPAKVFNFFSDITRSRPR